MPPERRAGGGGREAGVEGEREGGMEGGRKGGRGNESREAAACPNHGVAQSRLWSSPGSDLVQAMAWTTI